MRWFDGAFACRSSLSVATLRQYIVVLAPAAAAVDRTGSSIISPTAARALPPTLIFGGAVPLRIVVPNGS